MESKISQNHKDRDKIKHIKLFIPGPVEVKEDILNEMSRPIIGHRSERFMELYRETSALLQRLMSTNSPVILSTSSATGIWEACARNLVKKKCLCLVNGAFSKKWHDLIALNGKKTGIIEAEWGKAIRPEEVYKKLKTNEYDALSFVHNETSTGVMNDLEEMSKVMKEFPSVIFMVDTVSSLGAVNIEVDKLGIDVCLASVQKALAVPPGLSLFSLSEKAFEKSKKAENKGYYFNFEVMMKYHNKGQTVSTPPISQIYALNRQLKKIFSEGLENRFRRHNEMAVYAREWAKKNFGLFAEPGYESETITCVKNTKNIDVGRLCKSLNNKGYEISNGYGSLKQKTFRIAHMGDLSLAELKQALKVIDEEVSRF